jgi:hypothetical protein
LQGERSRRAGGRSKRRKISPLIELVEWVFVISGIGGIDLDPPMAGQERSESLVNERGVR